MYWVIVYVRYIQFVNEDICKMNIISMLLEVLGLLSYGSGKLNICIKEEKPNSDLYFYLIYLIITFNNLYIQETNGYLYFFISLYETNLAATISLGVNEDDNLFFSGFLQGLLDETKCYKINFWICLFFRYIFEIACYRWQYQFKHITTGIVFWFNVSSAHFLMRFS